MATQPSPHPSAVMSNAYTPSARDEIPGRTSGPADFPRYGTAAHHRAGGACVVAGRRHRSFHVKAPARL
jgi:hypothetical protein